MDRPIVLFTNLFTVENKQVNQNKYIDILYIWLNNIINYGKLKDTDYCVLFIDEITSKYISQKVLFNTLMSKIKNSYLIIYKQPKTIKEGIMKRYNIDELLDVTKEIEHLNPQYIHLDVDVLVVNDIRKLFKNKEVINKTIIDLTPVVGNF